MLQRYLLTFMVFLVIAGCGETPTEPEPDGPEREPEPELVTPRLDAARAFVSEADLRGLCREEKQIADSLYIQETRTSSEGDC